MSENKIESEGQSEILEEIKKVTSVSLRNKLLMVDNLEDQRAKIHEEQYLAKYNQLKVDFDLKYNPIYQQISDIVQGKVDLKSLNLTAEEKAKYKITDNDAVEEAGIPNYWLNAIKNSKYFAVNDKDELVLAHLKDVNLSLVADKLDYSVDFIFDKNEFFEHEKLSLHFAYDNKKFEPIKQTGTNIVWSSSEKNPSLKIKTKKIKKGKSVETKKTEEQVASFFDIFADKEVTGEEFNDISGDAEFFRDELIPNSLEFYLDIMASDFEDEDMEEGEEGEETDEDTKQAPKGAKKGKKNEKCKNQ